MGRFNAASEMDKYGNGGGAGFFSLKNDGDVAKVRFLYNSTKDIDAYAAHKVVIDGKDRFVNCLREYNESKDKCPMCKAGSFQQVKLYIPIYNIDEDKVQVWERGKKFFNKISSICERYNKKPIVSQTFEIERNGKPGDTSTSYEIYRTEDEADDTVLDDFEMPEVLGTMLLDKSFEELEYYVENHSFPDGEQLPFTESKDETPRRRVPSRRREGF